VGFASGLRRLHRRCRGQGMEGVVFLEAIPGFAPDRVLDGWRDLDGPILRIHFEHLACYDPALFVPTNDHVPDPYEAIILVVHSSSLLPPTRDRQAEPWFPFGDGW
jgi:hypothetical protein